MISEALEANGHMYSASLNRVLPDVPYDFMPFVINRMWYPLSTGDSIVVTDTYRLVREAPLFGEVIEITWPAFRSPMQNEIEEFKKLYQ